MSFCLQSFKHLILLTIAKTRALLQPLVLQTRSARSRLSCRLPIRRAVYAFRSIGALYSED